MKGFSLLEVIIVMSISVVAGVLLVVIMVNSLGLFYKESAKFSEGLSANEILSNIRFNIKESNGVATSYTDSGVTYNSSANQLVFKIASVDTSGNMIADTFDYYVYYQDQNFLRFKTFPNSLSSRKSSDRIFTNSLDNLIFQYQSSSNPPQEVAPQQAAKVKITLTLKQKSGANFEIITLTTEANLRND